MNLDGCRRAPAGSDRDLNLLSKLIEQAEKKRHGKGAKAAPEEVNQFCMLDTEFFGGPDVTPTGGFK